LLASASAAAPFEQGRRTLCAEARWVCLAASLADEEEHDDEGEEAYVEDGGADCEDEAFQAGEAKGKMTLSQKARPAGRTRTVAMGCCLTMILEGWTRMRLANLCHDSGSLQI